MKQPALVTAFDAIRTREPGAIRFESPRYESSIDNVRSITATDMPVIVADNVADYYETFCESLNQHPSALNLKLLPSVAPPFQYFAIDMRASWLVGDFFRRCCVLFLTYDLQKQSGDVALPMEKMEVDKFGDRGMTVGEELLPLAIKRVVMEAEEKRHGTTAARQLDAARWASHATLVAWNDGKVEDAWRPMATYLSLLDERGQYLQMVEQTAMQMDDETVKKPEGFEDHLMGAMTAFRMCYCTAALTISLMNCRNVEVITCEQPEKFARKFQNKHRRAMVQYKMLSIDLTRRVYEREGARPVADPKRKISFHICRGSFATYTPEKPLFGRPQTTSITVWRPGGFKGAKEAGSISKKYDVIAPQAGKPISNLSHGESISV